MKKNSKKFQDCYTKFMNPNRKNEISKLLSKKEVKSIKIGKNTTIKNGELYRYCEIFTEYRDRQGLVNIKYGSFIPQVDINEYDGFMQNNVIQKYQDCPGSVKTVEKEFEELINSKSF
jgi:hypothetical protein